MHIAEAPWNGPDWVVLYRPGSAMVLFASTLFTQKTYTIRLVAQEYIVRHWWDATRSAILGKVNGYNVHAVDGIVLANGYHVLRDDYAGKIAGAANEGEGSDRMTVPRKYLFYGTLYRQFEYPTQ